MNRTLEVGGRSLVSGFVGEKMVACTAPAASCLVMAGLGMLGIVHFLSSLGTRGLKGCY